MEQNEKQNSLEIRRRRLLYRATHRGTFETDLLVGEFAKQYLSTMSEAEIILFEQIMAIPDADLSMWLMGQQPIPKEIDTIVFQAMYRFIHNT